MTLLFTAAAYAADFGAHLGYFGNDVRKPQVGVDLNLPFGMFALTPNIDYSRSKGIGLWFANIDGALRFNPNGGGPQFSVGAGPTYGYVTGYGSARAGGYSIVHSDQYSGNPGTGTPGTGTPGNGSSNLAAGFNGSSRAWGWDVNTAVTFASAYRPYVALRYNKVKNMKATGVAVGLRFGR